MKMYFLWANTFKITFLILLVFSIVAPMCLKVRNSNVTVLMKINKKIKINMLISKVFLGFVERKSLI